MTLYRFVFTAIAMAVYQMVAAQSPPLDTKNPTIWTDASATPAVDASAPAADPNAKEPRIYRGDDRMVAPPKAVGGVEGASSTFNFEEAPVAEVVRAILGDMLKVDYVLHPPLQGTVTLSTRTAVSADQAVFLLESALLANGLAMSRDARGSYHVGKPETLKGIGSAIRQVTSGVLPPGTGAIIVPLRYIGATEMAAILKPLVPGDAVVRVDTVRNLLILAGNRTQAEGWLDIVSTFDVNLLKGMSVGVFPLKYASVKDVELALRLMTPGGAGGEGTPAAPAAATGAAGRANAAAQAAAAQTSGNLAENNPFLGALRIMPIERINSIMVVTPRAAYLEEARQWIERLDKPSDGGSEPQLYVYPVQNGNARHLSEVLNGIFGNGSSIGSSQAGTGVAPGLGQFAGTTGGFGTGGSAFGNGGLGAGGFGAGGFGTGGFGTGAASSGSFGNNAFGNRNTNATAGASRASGASGGTGTSTGGAVNGVRLIADEVNNSILIYGTRGDYNKIEAAMRKLDIAPVQVLIEASIIEVRLVDDLQYGLQWFFSDKTRGSNTGAGGVGGAGNGNGGPLISVPALRDVSKSTIPGFAYSLTDAAGNIRATLNALADKSLLKVISSPSVMVMDNYPANISVGDQIPIPTGGITTGISGVPSVTTTIQYKDTGVQLGVLPSVNAGDIITLDINQNVSNATGNAAQPIISQRQIASKVAVRSGETLVLGGLILDNTTRQKSGVPFLQDIPYLGAAFGSTLVKTERTELIVIITPRVVRNALDLKEVNIEMRDRLRGLGSVGPQDVPAAAARLLNEPTPAPQLKPTN